MVESLDCSEPSESMFSEHNYSQLNRMVELETLVYRSFLSFLNQMSVFTVHIVYQCI